jgi:hypothetical protein
LGGGFSTLLAAHVEHALHRDLTIEASEAGPSVEIAAALGAALVPMHRKEFSMLGLAKMGAGLLSRLSGASVGSVPPFVLDLPDLWDTWPRTHCTSLGRTSFLIECHRNK